MKVGGCVCVCVCEEQWVVCEEQCVFTSVSSSTSHSSTHNFKAM